MSIYIDHLGITSDKVTSLTVTEVEAFDEVPLSIVFVALPTEKDGHIGLGRATLSLPSM
jgi:hypothetical protein